jgi:histidyl-tRNA synthetase
MFFKVKGTNDFLDLTLINFIVTEVKNHLALYHFTEIETPILETTELFTRILGQHTDVVHKEMFLIESRDEEKKGLICLRPEITASIARAFVENGVQAVPWKVFTYGQCFRYERPQKGRFREFHQISIEAIGSQSVAQDVQFITMLDRLFHEKIKFNNYALLLNYLGCPEDRAAYKIILKKFLDDHVDQLCPLCLERKEKNIMRVFDCKVPENQELYKKAPVIIDHMCATCTAEWKQLQNDLELLSVSFTVQPTLVRGLDYYNKTVFEFVSGSLGAQNAFCGGGRYDSLIGQLGGKPDQPSIGAAIGVERLELALEPIKDSLQLPQLPQLCLVLPFTQAQHSLALLLADELLAAGLCTDLLLEGDSVKSMMKKANKMGARFALLLGEDEQKNNQVTVKNMITGAEEKMDQSQVVAYLKS